MSSKCGALGWKLTRQGLLTWHTLSWAVLYWRSSPPNFVVLAFYIAAIFVLVGSSRKVKYSMPLSIVSCLWLCQCVMRHADGLKNVTRKRAGLSNSVAKSNIKFEFQIFKFGIFWYLYSKCKYLGPNIEYSLEWHKDLTSSLSPWQIWKRSRWENAQGKKEWSVWWSSQLKWWSLKSQRWSQQCQNNSRYSKILLQFKSWGYLTPVTV